MKECVGSIWKSGADAIVIPTNLARTDQGMAIMGAGLARQAKDRVRHIDRWLGAYLEITQPWANGSNGRYATTIWVHDLDTWIVALPTKRSPFERGDISLIREGIHDLTDLAAIHHWESIALPRLGCGRGELAWEVIKCVLRTDLDDRFTVYSLTENE